MKSNIVLINLILTLATITHSIDDQSINVALETVLEFDKNDRQEDIKIIDQLQSFLKKIEISMKKRKREPLQQGHFIKSRYIKDSEEEDNSKELNNRDHIAHLVDLFRSLDKREVYLIFKTIQKETRKSYNRDCRIGELVRRSITNGLQTLKKEPNFISEEIDKQFYPSPETQSYSNMNSGNVKLTEKIFTWLDKLYLNSEKFQGIIKDLNDYSKSKLKHEKQKKKEANHNEIEYRLRKTQNKNNNVIDLRDAEKLVRLVKKAMGALFSDQYLNNSEKRHVVQREPQNVKDPNEDAIRMQNDKKKELRLDTKEFLHEDHTYHLSNHFKRKSKFLKHLPLMLSFQHDIIPNISRSPVQSVFNSTHFINGSLLYGNATHPGNLTQEQKMKQKEKQRKKTNKQNSTTKAQYVYFTRPKMTTSDVTHKSTTKSKFSRMIFGFKPKKKKKFKPPNPPEEIKKKHKLSKKKGKKSERLLTKQNGRLEHLRELLSSRNQMLLPLSEHDDTQATQLHIKHKHTKHPEPVKHSLTEEIQVATRSYEKIDNHRKSKHKHKIIKPSDKIKSGREENKDLNSENAITKDIDEIKLRSNTARIENKTKESVQQESDFKMGDKFEKEIQEEEDCGMNVGPTKTCKTLPDLDLKRNDSSNFSRNAKWERAQRKCRQMVPLIRNFLRKRPFNAYRKIYQEKTKDTTSRYENQTKNVLNKEKIAVTITNKRKAANENKTNSHTDRAEIKKANTNTTRVTVDTFIVEKDLTPEKEKVLNIVKNMTNKDYYEKKELLHALPNINRTQTKLKSVIAKEEYQKTNESLQLQTTKTISDVDTEGYTEIAIESETWNSSKAFLNKTKN